jgi:hypothetical protein
MENKIIPSFKIDKEGIKKVGRGAIIAGLGAFLTYGAENLLKLDFGEWTPLVVAGLSVFINFLRKWIFSYYSQ